MSARNVFTEVSSHIADDVISLAKEVNHYWWGRNRPEVREYEAKMKTRDHLVVVPRTAEEIASWECNSALAKPLGAAIGIVLLAAVGYQLYSAISSVL